MTKAKMNFEGMSPAEIETILESAKKALPEAVARNHSAAMAEIEAVAEKHNYTLKELFPKTRRKTGPVTPKYRNPEDESQTWAGRGRKPAWVTAFEAAGGTLDSVAI